MQTVSVIKRIKKIKSKSRGDQENLQCLSNEIIKGEKQLKYLKINKKKLNKLIYLYKQKKQLNVLLNDKKFNILNKLKIINDKKNDLAKERNLIFEKKEELFNLSNKNQMNIQKRKKLQENLLKELISKNEKMKKHYGDNIENKKNQVLNDKKESFHIETKIKDINNKIIIENENLINLQLQIQNLKKSKGLNTIENKRKILLIRLEFFKIHRFKLYYDKYSPLQIKAKSLMQKKVQKINQKKILLNHLQAEHRIIAGLRKKALLKKKESDRQLLKISSMGKTIKDDKRGVNIQKVMLLKSLNHRFRRKKQYLLSQLINEKRIIKFKKEY